jgi:predicted esterase YcpF (UPF0227 family)
MLIYIHGFNSSPASHKARILKQRLEVLGKGAAFWCPALSDRPAQAIALLENGLRDGEPQLVTLVGSSLGGYYAAYLAEKFALKAVLVNPAVRPYEGLRAYLGPQKNMYSGQSYELTQQHLDELRALDRNQPTRMDRYYLMVTTGDEVLDHRVAVRKYAGARQLVVQDSDHGFPDFAHHLDSVLDFATPF